MQTQPLKRAVIYCRVSTKEQVDEGNSLITQEKHCKEYALKNGYEIVQPFIEQGESAKTSHRTELQKMLNYLADRKNKVEVVITYKIDRLSRNTDDYSQIRILLKRYGVEIKSVTEYFENTPAGRFMENIIANVAQFDNDVRAERCAGGMKDAMREGRYVWAAPVGYENTKVGGKATICQNPIMAPLIRETFEIISKNLYATENVRKMMIERGLCLKNGKPLSKQYFYDMLKNKLYTGVIEKFGEKHTGLFEPIVDEELFNQVQRVLRNRGKKMAQYQLDSEDFPLRRFVINEQGKRLTGSWCKGRSAKYAYYRFGVKGSNYTKEAIEGKFMQFMDKYALNPELISKLKLKIKEHLGKATQQEQKDGNKLRTHIEDLQSRQNTLIRKNLDGFISDTILKQQLEIIDKDLETAQGNLSSIQETEIDIEEVFKFVERYLENPSSVWKEAKLDKRLKLQWFQFPQGMTLKDYDYGTTQVANVFKTKEAFLPLQSTKVDLDTVFINRLLTELDYLSSILKT